jgi:hypothetical protein
MCGAPMSAFLGFIVRNQSTRMNSLRSIAAIMNGVHDPARDTSNLNLRLWYSQKNSAAGLRRNGSTHRPTRKSWPHYAGLSKIGPPPETVP